MINVCRVICWVMAIWLKVRLSEATHVTERTIHKKETPIWYIIRLQIVR